MVGRQDIFAHCRAHDIGQGLSAIFDRRLQCGPATCDISVERLLEPGRRSDAAVGIADAAFLVAHGVQGKQDLRRQLAAFSQDRVDQIGRGVFKPR